MDSSASINSAYDNRLFLQETFMEKDKDQGIKNVVQQSIYEEKLANNGLSVSIFFHLFVIASTMAIVFLKMNLISVYRENNPDQDTISFNLFEFNLNIYKSKNSYSFSCYIKSPASEESPVKAICTIDEKCQKRGLSSAIIERFFEMNCEDFIQFKIIGLIYIVTLVAGNLLGLTSAFVILLLLYDKISLEKTEQIIFFTKFESAAYFFGFFIYFSFVGIFMEMNSHFLKQIWFLIILFAISFSNFLIFRRSFYNKLRIKARIL